MGPPPIWNPSYAVGAAYRSSLQATIIGIDRLLLTHNEAASGSAQMDDCTNLFKASISLGLSLDRRLATTSRPTYPIARQHGGRSQIGQATTDRAACNTGCDTAAPRHVQHTRFTRSKQATFSLVQDRRQRIVVRQYGSVPGVAGQQETS